jgi:2,5-diketo-D-gluconate reductase B
MKTATVAGTDVPKIGFGTARMDPEPAEAAVESALELGYRHIDTAQQYGTEGAVGRAIANAAVDEDDVFVVTKIAEDNLAPDAIRRTFAESEERLGLETIDLLLLHVASPTVPIADSIAVLDELHAAGRVANIGVSNYSVDQLETAVDAADAPILTNQVRYNPFTPQEELLGYCRDHDILLTAHTPLALGDVHGHETFQEIGERYGKSAAQVALRWLVQQDHVAAIPKAADPRHRRENLQVFDFELTPDEMDRIAALGF